MKSNSTNLPECKTCSIRKAALFGELENEHIDKARELRTCQQTYVAGEYLYHEGDVSDKAFTIYSGWVSLFKNLENGDRQILRFALPGDLLCYKIGRNKKLDHSAMAISDTTLCAFPLDGFRRVIAELPELAFAISAVTEAVTERCHAALTTIASHPAETKVAFLLLSLYLREQSLHDEALDFVKFPITQEDIGDALGLTSIHVNRVFQSLRNKGLIECKNKCLWVLDEHELAEVAKIGINDLKKMMISV